MPEDGEPVVPCAQGRVVIETVRHAPPHFATCSTYRKQLANRSELSRMKKTKTVDENKSSKGTAVKTTTTITLTVTTESTTASSTVTRPENLHIKSCLSNTPTETSPSLIEKQSSHPLLTFDDNSISAELMSTRNSSVESDPLKVGTNIQRKAYMDLRDAIALLDETCPNPNTSPSVTPRSPRTPRTPLTPHPRSKRARSKSSDNSSNYSNDRLSEKSFENPKVLEKSKKRPFLRKLGISMTDERPFFAKLAPKIIGKPYLEKIGPSKAVEKPYLDKIGSSKTLDKFIFEGPKCEIPSDKIIEENEKLITDDKKIEIKTFSKRSGKGFLRKMYSFETEDLEDTSVKKHHRDPLRGTSLDDVIDTGSTSLASIQTVEHKKPPCTAKLVKCKVTMSEEVLSSNSCLSSSVEGPMWENSPRRKRKTKNFLAQTITKSDTLSSKEGLRSDESVPNSPTKRRLNVDNASGSPAKSRRQISEDILDKKLERYADFNRYAVSSDDLFTVKNKIPANVKNDDNNSQDVRRSNHNYNKETFKQLYNRFESQEVPTESYAEFKQRTQKNIYSTSALRRVPDVNKISLPSLNFESSFQEVKLVYDEPTNSTTNSAKSEFLKIRSRSVLRKQEGIDQTSDQECDTNTTPNRPKKQILHHQPSQETVDLLTELRRVKSLLKTPSYEKDLDLDEIKDIVKFPKKVQLTDKEFCLSVERENSIRRPKATCSEVGPINDNIPVALSPSFFSEQSPSIEYADDDRSPKAEMPTISLSSAKCRPSELEETTTDLTPICDSQSYTSDVFSSPSGDEVKQQEVSLTADTLQHYDVDISIPVNEKGCSSDSTTNLQNQAKTIDQYEIMSPRVTPFKLKKRLGKISVEDTMKHENFALDKVDCRSVAVQKRTRCFPL